MKFEEKLRLLLSLQIAMKRLIAEDADNLDFEQCVLLHEYVQSIPAHNDWNVNNNPQLAYLC